MAQVGVEPTAFLLLRENGRPVAYRARSHSSGGTNRTFAAWFRARYRYQQRLPRKGVVAGPWAVGPATAEISRDGRIQTGALLHPMQADSTSLSHIPRKWRPHKSSEASVNFDPKTDSLLRKQLLKRASL